MIGYIYRNLIHSFSIIGLITDSRKEVPTDSVQPVVHEQKGTLGVFLNIFLLLFLCVCMFLVHDSEVYL